METIKRSFRDRFAHPQYLAVELIILVAAVYNFTVTARFQGWESLDPTVKQGAVVFALIIDGGLFTSLFLMRDAHFREQEKRAKTWRNWAILFGGITCLMALLFNGSHWHPDPVSATSWVGTLLSWIETSGTALVLKSVGPIVALYPLAHYAPVKGQSLADVQTEADKMVAREEALTRVHELRQKRDPKQALREAKEAERRLLVRLRAELVRAGVSHPERKTDDWVRIKAAALGIYDPASDTVTEYKPKPMAPFNQVLEIALAHGLVSDEEVEDASYNSGPARTEWQNEVRERIENAGLTPEVVEPKQEESKAVVAGVSPPSESPTGRFSVAEATQALLSLDPMVLNGLLANAEQMPPEEWIALFQQHGSQAASSITSEQVQAVVAAVRTALSQGAGSASTPKGATNPKLPAVSGVDLATIKQKKRYTITEAADICRIPRATFDYWAKHGTIDCHQPRHGAPWLDYDQLCKAFEQTGPERQKRAQVKSSLQVLPPASGEEEQQEEDAEEASAI